MKEFLRSLTPVFRREFVRKITSAFRDVAELKQNISSLRETMETQRLLIDHQSRSLESYRQQLIDRQQRLDALQDQMDARLTQLSAQLQQMDDQAKQLDANLLQQTSESQRQRFETAAKLDRIHQDHDGQQLKRVAQGEAFAEQKRFLASLARTVSSYFLQSLSNGSASAPHSIGPAVVSIIMPTRNRGAFITRAIRSILLQTFADWELIIVDDGSTDATSQIVQAFLGDERIRYVTNVRCGAASARNRGIELSRGRFIAYLDSDNIFYPDFLAHAVKFFLGNEFADIGYGILTSNEHDASGFFYFSGFDRNELLKANYIDLNCVIHRKTLVDAYGVFDEALTRLLDWDLILRYTTEKPAYPLPVLAAAYQTDAANRITTEYAFADNAFKIRRKWRAQIGRATPLRVLYVLWHYPQLSETYLETEIQCMRRWGVQVEVWRSTSQQAAPYMSETPVHDGRLEDAVRAFQPHIVHTHWLGFTLSQQERLEATNLPVTVRLHGFDTTRDGLRELLNKKWVRGVYGFPAHLTLLDEEDHRLKMIQVGFESTRFFPKFNKNRRMLLRAGAALPSKDLRLFIDVAKLLPDYRCVLALVTCLNKEDYVADLRAYVEETSSPVELLYDVPFDQMAELMQEAGFYVHTNNGRGAQFSTPAGMPVSIAEAMATGAYVLV